MPSNWENHSCSSEIPHFRHVKQFMWDTARELFFIAPVKYPTGVIDSSRKYFSWPSLVMKNAIFRSA
jgi:hypothetical protein